LDPFKGPLRKQGVIATLPVKHYFNDLCYDWLTGVLHTLMHQGVASCWIL